MTDKNTSMYRLSAANTYFLEDENTYILTDEELPNEWREDFENQLLERTSKVKGKPRSGGRSVKARSGGHGVRSRSSRNGVIRRSGG